MPREGNILRVNLSREQVRREALPAELRQRFLGGEGINAWLLWEHFLRVDPKLDPLSPDNVLILGMGPLGGTGLGAGSKMKFTYKSPAYHIYGDTSGGGGLGSQLRWAGYDHVVVTGKARRPVYLWIKDDDVEIRGAQHLWGKGVHEADESIKEALGDGEIETACIGPAGENLAGVASIMVSQHRAAARGGGGCVFGSKNLKAIACRGTKGMSIHDPVGFFQAMEDFLAARNRDARIVGPAMKYGTLDILRRQHGLGFNTYRNGQGRDIPDEDMARLDHNWYVNHMGVRAMSCSPGCAFACGNWYHLRGNESPAAPQYAGEWGTRPEYGTANPFGGGCGLPDLPAVAHLNKMCNQYGMDTIELGMAIAFLMELWERGVITPEDTYRWSGEEPLSLEWGNYGAMERVIRYAATRCNQLGEVLQGGVYQAAVNIGQLKGIDVLKYANYGKAGSTHHASPRAWPAMGLACATASIGGHHLKGVGITPGASVKYLGRPDAGDALGTTLIGSGQALAESLMAIFNCLGACWRMGSRDPDVVPLDIWARALRAAEGVDLTAEQLLVAGERAVNLQKAFNSRLGLRREDDTVCHRWLNEPQLEGRSKGMRMVDFLESAKDEYYQRHGWDVATSLQTRARLEELDMGDVAGVLEREGHLA